MRAVLAMSRWSPSWGALDDGGLGDGTKDEGGRVEEGRDEGRRGEEEGLWLPPFRKRRTDLTLRDCTRLWVLWRRVILRRGPVPVLLNGCSDLETKPNNSKWNAAFWNICVLMLNAYIQSESKLSDQFHSFFYNFSALKHSGSEMKQVVIWHSGCFKQTTSSFRGSKAFRQLTDNQFHGLV